MSSSKIPKALPRGAKQMYVPGSSPEAQNANLRAVVDDMRAHISQLKKELEAEKGHVKEMKREKLSEIKSTRDQEQQKASLTINDLRSKLNHDRQRELTSLRETLGKQHDQEINRLLKQKQELLARTQSDAQREREMHFLKVKQQVWAEAKEEVKRTFEMDRGKLLAEMDELRRSKKKLEEELSDAVAGDRQRAADLRRQWGEHQREMEQLKKDARRDILRLMEELKSKDRVIGELEKELGHKSGYSQRLQMEKDSLGNLLNLSKMAESWDHRSSASPASHQDSSSLSPGGSAAGFPVSATNGSDEDDRKLQKKVVELNALLRKLEDKNKQLVEDKADLERKIRTSAEARNTTPLIEKNKRLLRKIKDLELSKKKLDERNKALTEENQKLRSLKENMRCRLERENQSLRKVLSKERQQQQQQQQLGVSPRPDGYSDKDEELKKLRVEVQEQFLEIVELKQAALEQERMLKATPDYHISRPRSSSLTPFSLDEDVGIRSRSGSLDTSLLSPLALSDCEDGGDEDLYDEQPTKDGKKLTAAQQIKTLRQQNKDLEEKCSKFEWMLQDSKDQNELLEFRILELEEEEEDSTTPVASPSTDDETIQSLRIKSLQVSLQEKDEVLVSLQKEVESQRECVQQMEEAKELISMRQSKQLANEDEPTLHHRLHVAKMRVSDLERTEAHLHARIQDLEEQLAQLQEDIHLGLAERNRERTELEAEIASLRQATERIGDEKDEVLERLRTFQENGESWKEEEEKLLKKLKKKEQSETTFRKQIDLLKLQLSDLHERNIDNVAPAQDSSIEAAKNEVTMEDLEDVNILKQKVELLELEKGSLEAKLRDVEELVLNSDFASEESLRERIAELELSNKSLNRQLKQSQASDVENKDMTERAAADAKHTEKALQARIQEMQQSEQSLLDRVAQMEEQDNARKAQVESLQDTIQGMEQLRQELKDELDAAKEHIEELQVAEKFARDELSASHGASSFLGESLGLMGELESLAEEEYVEYEEQDVQEETPQEEESLDHSLQINEELDGNRISEFEKSETELMEKVQVLEQANTELSDLCQELKNQAFEFADENEILKEKIQELEEMQSQIPDTVNIIQQVGEEKKTLTDMVAKLESQVESLTHEIDTKGEEQQMRELITELEDLKEKKIELSEMLNDEVNKSQELRNENERLKEQLLNTKDGKFGEKTEKHILLEELHQELDQSRSEKAQLEEEFQTECKELKSMVEELEAVKESLEQQLESSEHELHNLEEVSSELHTELEHRIEELEREKQDLVARLGEQLEQKPDSSTDSSETEDRLQEVKKLEKENQDLILKLASAEEQCQRLKEEVDHLERKIEERKSELTVARKDSMRRSLEVGDSSRELAEVKKRLKELEDVESQFFDQTEVLAKMVREKEDWEKQLENSREEEENIAVELQEANNSIEDLETVNEGLQDKLDNEERLLEESSEQFQKTKEELESTKEELCLQKKQVVEVEARSRELEERLHQLEDVGYQQSMLQSSISTQTQFEEGSADKESVDSLNQRIKDLTQREEDLQMKVVELEERQDAYEETISQADLIVSETHQKLSEQTGLLEAKEQELQQAKEQLESQKTEELPHKLQLLANTSRELQEKTDQLEAGEEKLKKLKNSLEEYKERCQLQEDNLKRLEQEQIALSSKSSEISSQAADVTEPIIKKVAATSQESANMNDLFEDTIVSMTNRTENEEVLQQKIVELEERHTAFEETLAQADILLTETKQKLHDKLEICNSQENELLELRQTVANLREELQLMELNAAAAEELERKSQLLEETSMELQVKTEKECEALMQSLESSERKCKDLEERLEATKQFENLTDLEDGESLSSLRQRIADMTKHEVELQQRIDELEERQSAFQETLAHADVIMTEREAVFLDQINDLQTSHSDLREKLRRVSETSKKYEDSKSSDEDDDDDAREFSVFSKKDDSDEEIKEREKIQFLENKVEQIEASKKELLKVIDDYKDLEDLLKAANNEMEEELNLSKEKIKQLERALENDGPDNDVQVELEELRSSVQLHADANLKLQEEIDVLKGTICELQEQLLQAPHQEISQDGFLRQGASEEEVELITPQIVVPEEGEIPQQSHSEELSKQVSLEQEIMRLEEEVRKTRDQLESVFSVRDALKADVLQKESEVERLQKANKSLQDDIHTCMVQIEELKQQHKNTNRISQENNNVTNSSSKSESQSGELNASKLQESISDLKTKLESTEIENSKLRDVIAMKTENTEKERKDRDNSEQQLKVKELEESVETLKKEMASANSERVKTTYRLMEVVQFNREIKKDLRDLEESEKILKEENQLLKREKDVLNQKLFTLGISGDDILKEWLESQDNEDSTDQKEDAGTKNKFGEGRKSYINEGCQTGTLSYIPNECLLATVLIEEFEMTLKEFLEALPFGHSPTDPVLLKEGKHYFVEFNKLFIDKCRTPRARLLQGLTKGFPTVKKLPVKKRKKPKYPSLPGEECSKQQAGEDSEASLRPLEAASPTTKRKMLDELVEALWEIPWEMPPDIDWNTASIWCPDDELEIDDDSLDTSESRPVEAVNEECGKLEAVSEECGKLVSIEPEPRSKPALAPPGSPPGSPPVRKRTGSMSSDSLSEDPPPLPAGSPPRRIIREDSLEVESDDDEELSELPPPLPSSLPPSRPDLKTPTPTTANLQSFSHTLNNGTSLDHHDESQDQGLPPPLPITSPPKKSVEGTGPNDTDKQRSPSGTYNVKDVDGQHHVPYQNGHSTATYPDSDTSSTDTVTDHETFLKNALNNDPSSAWNGNNKDVPPSRANVNRRQASFDSGLDTVSSITEQEVEAITAASVFAGPDNSLRLPKPPGVREGAGSSLAKPSTPMWLKQMMDWQTAEKEKEETDLGRLRTSIDTMEKQLQEKEDLVKKLRKSEEDLKRKLRDYGDLRPLKLQLQTKDIDLQDKERQVALLKSEVKQREREVNELKSKLEKTKQQQNDINSSPIMVDNSAEMARLKMKLEQSQEGLKEKERQLKTREEEETRIKQDMKTREQEISSKEEELTKQSEELRNLEAQLKELQPSSAQNSDRTDGPTSAATLSHDRSPDRSWHDRPPDGGGSHERHLASALDVLTRENEDLRGRVERLASIEARWEDLQHQLDDSRRNDQDRDALERKLLMAEDILREKTGEEMRLAEDNAALEDRVRRLEEQKRRRDGIEEDYRRIKDKFDEMEHKKNEAEISVAPLKAKVSYLLQKCKERDTIIQRFAAELEHIRPDRTQQLLSEVNDLTVVSLPGEEFNQPLPISSRGATGGARGGAREGGLRGRDSRRHRKKLDRYNRSVDDVRADRLSDDDDELGLLSAARGQSTLDPLGGSLDDLGLGGELSLNELVRQTSGSRSRSHLTPLRGADDMGSDLLRSMLNTSPSRTRYTSRHERDAQPSSRSKTKANPLRHNGLSHETLDTDTDVGPLDRLPRGSPPRASHHDVPLDLTRMTRSAYQPSSQNGNVNIYIPPPTNTDLTSPSLLPSVNAGHSSHTPSNLTNSTAFRTDPASLHSQLGARHKTSNHSPALTTAAAAPTETHLPLGSANQTNTIQPSNNPLEDPTGVTHNGSAYGLMNGKSSLLAPIVGSGEHPGMSPGSGIQSSTGTQLSVTRLDGPSLHPQSHAVHGPYNGSVAQNSSMTLQMQTANTPLPSGQPAQQADVRIGPTSLHHGITNQNGGIRPTAQTVGHPSYASFHHNGLPNQGVYTGAIDGTTAFTHNGGLHQVIGNTSALQHGNIPSSLYPDSTSSALTHNGTVQQTAGITSAALHHGNNTSSTYPNTTSSSAHPVLTAHQFYRAGVMAMGPSSSHHTGIGSSSPGLRVTGQAGNAVIGSGSQPLHPGISTTVMHPGASKHSTTTQMTQPGQNSLLNQSAPHLSPQLVNTSSLLSSSATSYDNSSLTTLQSPDSTSQVLSAASHSPMDPSPGNGRPTASVLNPSVPQSAARNNITSHTLSGPEAVYTTHLGHVSNGATSSHQRGISLHHHNGTRGVDEPDRIRTAPHGTRVHANGRGSHHVPSHGVHRTPNIPGVPQPPLSLTLSKVIGRHGAVLTWYPPDLDELGRSNGLEIVGYKIFVDGRQKQLVTNAHLTKALVDGINLRTVRSFGIQTVSATGQTSPIIKTEFEDAGLLSSSWSDGSVVTESSAGGGTVTSEGSSVVSEEIQERLFMAVYNYNPVEHSPNNYPTYELAFVEGDIVTVYGTIRPDGFYKGKVRGRKGLVPSNFIEEISMSGSHHSKKKHGHTKSDRNGIGDVHKQRVNDVRGTKESTRTPTKTPSKKQRGT